MSLQASPTTWVGLRTELPDQIDRWDRLWRDCFTDHGRLIDLVERQKNAPAHFLGEDFIREGRVQAFYASEA